MASQDTKNTLDPVQSLKPVGNRTSSENGLAVGLASFRSRLFVVDVATITDGTHDITAEEADASGGPFTVVAAKDLIGAFATLASDTIQKVGYVGAKAFIRAVATVSGASTGGAYGVSVVRGNAQKQPI